MALATLDTQHQGDVNDVQLDYYGGRLVTASNDCSVRVWDSCGESGAQRLVQELLHHSGPVWEVAWAHPKFGQLIASVGYDRHVCLWLQNGNQPFQLVHVDDSSHKSSVNSVSFAGEQHGLVFATGSSDGTVTVHELDMNSLAEVRKTSVPANRHGVLSVDFCAAELRIACGGCDGALMVFEKAPATGDWIAEEVQGAQQSGAKSPHDDFVRSVAFRPVGVGGSSDRVIASAGDDGKVVLWQSNSEAPFEAWRVLAKLAVPADPAPTEGAKPEALQSVAWSQTGDVLFASGVGERLVSWREVSNGRWELSTDAEGC